MVLLLILLLSAQAAEVDAPAPELLSFDRRVTTALRGRVDAPLKAGLRAELEGIRARVPSTPANTELHGLIQARLKDGADRTAASQSAALAAGRLRHEQGDYAGALAYAEVVLAAEPGNAAALGLKRLSEGRSRGPASTPAAKAATPAPSAAASTVDSDAGKPYKLAMKGRPTLGAVPKLELEGETAGYIAPGAKKPSLMRRRYNGLASAASYNLHVATPEEVAKLASVKRTLESTPTGQRIISDLGGWKEISRQADVTFAPIVGKGMNAYVRPLLFDKQGRKYALVINTELLSHPDEVIAPILAHELRHIQDMSNGGFSEGLAIPSELAAHRQQVYVFKELESGLSVEKRDALEKDGLWNYNLFLADLWQDRILQRFPNERDFIKRFHGTDMPLRAKAAYLDLTDNVASPGSPHLDYHLTSPLDGVYSVLSDEKDILDAVAERRRTGNYSGPQQESDERALNRRAHLIGGADRLDSDYREQNGYRLE